MTIETMLESIKEALLEGEPTTLRHFGTIGTKKRAAKIGRNLRKNVAVEIPEHSIVVFKPAKELAQLIRSNVTGPRKNVIDTNEDE